MKTLTLRNVPDEVAEHLGTLAEESRQSVNTTILQVLQNNMGGGPMLRKKRDLSAFSGAWSQAEAKVFERATETFERVDEEMWKP
jgi:hypothetical protein